MHLAWDWEVIVKVKELERLPNLVSLCYSASKNSELKFSLSLPKRLPLMEEVTLAMDMNNTTLSAAQ